MTSLRLWWFSVGLLFLAGYLPLGAAQQVACTEYVLSGRDLVVTVFDVGQADALYIKTPDNRQVIIDGGSPAVQLDDGAFVQSHEILPLLLQRGVTALDAVILSHPHPDHVNGLIKVIQDLPVGVVYISGYNPGGDEYRKFLEVIEEKHVPLVVVRSGDRVPLGTQVFLEVLAPPRAFYFSDANNNSLIVRLSYLDFCFIAAGDAETEELDWVSGIVEHQRWNDVLKVPHHGSYDAVNGTFLNAVNPSCAIISCGRQNPFDHPHRKTQSFYRSKGISQFRTDLSGSLTVLSNGEQFAVFSEHLK